MANEAVVSCGLNISVGNYKYQAQPTNFRADVSASGAKGPTPGSVLVVITGTTVDLSKLTAPGGLARLFNTDETSTITLGLSDPDTSKFYPMLDLLPGESYIVRLAQHMTTEYGAGTGTTGSAVVLQARLDPFSVTGTTAWLVCEAFNL